MYQEINNVMLKTDNNWIYSGEKIFEHGSTPGTGEFVFAIGNGGEGVMHLCSFYWWRWVVQYVCTPLWNVCRTPHPCCHFWTLPISGIVLLSVALLFTGWELSQLKMINAFFNTLYSCLHTPYLCSLSLTCVRNVTWTKPLVCFTRNIISNSICMWYVVCILFLHQSVHHFFSPSVCQCSHISSMMAGWNFLTLGNIMRYHGLLMHENTKWLYAKFE